MKPQNYALTDHRKDLIKWVEPAVAGRIGGEYLGEQPIDGELVVAVHMVLGHDPLVDPEHVPLAPVDRLQVRRLRQLPARPKRNERSSPDPGTPDPNSLGGRTGNEPEGLDEGSAGEHDGEGTPLGGELLGQLRRVLGQRDRDVLLGVEGEQVPLRRGGGRGSGDVGGHRGCGRGCARGGEDRRRRGRDRSLCEVSG